MKKTFLILSAVLLLLGSAQMAAAELNANQFIIATILLTPRIVVVNVSCDGKPVANEPVTLTRVVALLNDAPVFERHEVTNDNGIAVFIVAYGKYQVTVNDQIKDVIATTLMGSKTVNFTACQ